MLMELTVADVTGIREQSEEAKTEEQPKEE